jgi:hypothetical protein
MAQVKHISYYTNVMQSWSKPLGSKPSEAQLSLAHVFGRPGKQSLAVAMALRDGGVTGAQIKLASSLVDGKATPQLNHMRDLIAAKLFTREAGDGYCLTLAPKGQQFVDLHGAKAAEKVTGGKPVAKAKGKAVKKAKAKPAPAETPTPEAATVTEGQPAEMTV